MRLTALLSGLVDATLIGPDAEIVDIVLDSREVSAGALFCCVPGAIADGHTFAPDAVAAGAVALLVDHRLELEVAQVIVADVRLAMAELAVAFHGDPSASMTIVGITGTNGKTTTAHLLANIMRADGRQVEVLGTLSGARTTPEAPDLQRTLAGWRDEGVEVVVMEVSSHALALHRVDGTRFRVAVFTNLSRDHLDFHASMEEYFSTKALLFEPRFSDRAVVNLDSPHGRLLRDTATIPTDGYSLDEAADLRATAGGSDLVWRGSALSLPIGGSFNVSNALAAAHAALVLGVDSPTIASGLSLPLVVPGRFESIDEGQEFSAIVDFAHTPDGLDQVLRAADELAAASSGRVLVVFGCGGDRDRSKREPMGAIAAERADVVIVTADNSRSEPTEVIAAAIMGGIEHARPTRANEVILELDRRRAIGRALDLAVRGDVVVIAGKGHESTQTIGDEVEPFDDRLVTRELLRRPVGDQP